jgi:predicted transcriptional regulator
MILKTRVFDLYIGRYKNLSELAKAMEISVSQIYRVLEGKRNINRKFIIGAIKAFPGYKFDDLFYFVPEAQASKTANAQPVGETKEQLG